MKFRVRPSLPLAAGLFALAGLSAPGATALAASTATSAPVHVAMVSCGTTTCDRAMLQIINTDRAQYHLPPLHMKRIQSDGNGACTGSYGHSLAMATSGAIWHTNGRFPRASFPRNLCTGYHYAGENVGESSSGNPINDLQTLNQIMMAEPHSHAVCVSTYNHACNLIDPNFRFVGIGIYVYGGTTWLTEDFLG